MDPDMLAHLCTIATVVILFVSIAVVQHIQRLDDRARRIAREVQRRVEREECRGVKSGGGAKERTD